MFFYGRFREDGLGVHAGRDVSQDGGRETTVFCQYSIRFEGHSCLLCRNSVAPEVRL